MHSSLQRCSVLVCFITCCLIGIINTLSSASENGGDGISLVASGEPGWPQFRGARRNGISGEKGLLRSWPENGPQLLWTFSDLGRGYSSPVISGGRIYITGDKGETLHIYALDLNGKTVWQAENGRAWRGSYPGSRSSCTVDGECVYHRNAHGRVVCLDAKTGKELWAVDTFKRFEMENITWGISECLLVHGGKVFVTVAGKKALMCTLDKRTGATIWASDPLMVKDKESRKLVAEKCCYASPVLCRMQGRMILFGLSMAHHFAVDAETGAILYTEPLPTRYSVITCMPVLYNNSIFVTAPDTKASGLFRMKLKDSAIELEKAWSSPLDNLQGGVVYVNGRLHGSRYRRPGGWVCLDASDGSVRYETREIARGSVLYADGRLYCLSEKGVMALLEPGEKGYTFRGRFQFVEDGRKKDVWPHPVILDGRLYLRYHDRFCCYDIKRTGP